MANTLPPLIAAVFLRPIRFPFAMFLLVCMAAVGCVERTTPPLPSFSIELKRPDDKVDVISESSQTTFSIFSPFGIGRARIERRESQWPKSIRLRLHLSGLENLQIANGRITLHASVSSTSEKPQVRLWKDQLEAQPLDSNSVFWMDIEMWNRDRKPANQIPLQDGYFEMQLPKAFFEDNPTSIDVHWINFYRV
jgi:hypothetical protein